MKSTNTVKRMKALTKSNFKDVAGLINYLEYVPYINNGGCGYAAYFIYKQLKQDGKKPDIVFMYDPWNERFAQNLEALKGNDVPTSCAHVMVKDGGIYYDSDGQHSFPMYTNRHSVPLSFLTKALENQAEWNSSFDRENLPIMEKKIGFYLPKS